MNSSQGFNLFVNPGRPRRTYSGELKLHPSDLRSRSKTSVSGISMLHLVRSTALPTRLYARTQRKIPGGFETLASRALPPNKLFRRLNEYFWIDLASHASLKTIFIPQQAYQHLRRAHTPYVATPPLGPFDSIHHNMS